MDFDFFFVFYFPVRALHENLDFCVRVRHPYEKNRIFADSSFQTGGSSTRENRFHPYKKIIIVVVNVRGCESARTTTIMSFAHVSKPTVAEHLLLTYGTTQLEIS